MGEILKKKTKTVRIKRLKSSTIPDSDSIWTRSGPDSEPATSRIVGFCLKRTNMLVGSGTQIATLPDWAKQAPVPHRFAASEKLHIWKLLMPICDLNTGISSQDP
ncbi:hypothetical protein JCM33374_g2591 [Metschnikowia sp. JCM 33374]|nr:hypothetical protein JCM33374_g2591 [Metschnikowia sp. JCM 33374]